MAGGSASPNGVTVENNGNQSYKVALSLMITLFFMVGFITVLNDVLAAYFKELYKLSVSESQDVALVFFGAYGIMSIPAGILIKKIGYKKGLMIGLITVAIGLLNFIPAGSIINDSMTWSLIYFLSALFVVATGLTVLQVAINPYIVVLGPEETGAARLNLAGALNSTATFLGPIIGGAFILKKIEFSDFSSEALYNSAKIEAVEGPYLVLALITIAIAVLLYFMKLPQILAGNENEQELTYGESLKKLVPYRHLFLGAGAIFFYVGTEVAIGMLLIQYLEEDSLIRYIGQEVGKYSIEALASSLLAYYWGAAMIGRFIGSAIGQKIKANTLLASVSVAALVLVLFSMVGVFLSNWTSISVMMLDTEAAGMVPFSWNIFSYLYDIYNVTFHFEPVSIPYAILFLVLVGLCNSVMWPSIFPLGIAKLGKLTSHGSGLMVTMVAGGAILPKIQGYLVPAIGFRFSFIVSIVCYAYILFFAIKGYKMGKISEEKTIE